MKVEIHCHTDVHSACSRIPPRELVAMADAAGYDAVFITDHGKVWSPRELAGLHEMSDRLRVYPGIEITFPEGRDILVLGADNPVYESLTTPSEVFAQACADGYLTVIAHPFRWHEDLPDFFTLADAIEVLTCNHPEERMAARARAYAERHNMAGVYASDAHGLNFMNKFWLETVESFDTPQEFRRIIVSRRFENRTRELAEPMPPRNKAACFAELSEADMMALYVQPSQEPTSF